jgi:hypothetical protein
MNSRRPELKANSEYFSARYLHQDFYSQRTPTNDEGSRKVYSVGTGRDGVRNHTGDFLLTSTNKAFPPIATVSLEGTRQRFATITSVTLAPVPPMLASDMYMCNQ